MRSDIRWGSHVGSQAARPAGDACHRARLVTSTVARHASAVSRTKTERGVLIPALGQVIEGAARMGRRSGDGWHEGFLRGGFAMAIRRCCVLLVGLGLVSGGLGVARAQNGYRLSVGPLVQAHGHGSKGSSTAIPPCAHSAHLASIVTLPRSTIPVRSWAITALTPPQAGTPSIILIVRSSMTGPR